ncbi:MAG: RNA polymerase sigma factor [Acidobacteriota bacterium]
MLAPPPTLSPNFPSDHVTMPSADFERLFRESSPMIYRSAYRLLANAEDAEDVLQTVFLRFLRRDSSQAVILQPETYLHRAAINAALDLLRARPRHAGPLDSLSAEPASPSSQELSCRLRDALSRLDPKAAEIFLLRYVEGYGNKEIAQLLDMSQTMVAVSLFRSRQKLQNEIRLTR